MTRFHLILLAILLGLILYLFIENQGMSAKIERLNDDKAVYEFQLGKAKIDSHKVKEIHHYHTTVNNIPYQVEVQTKPDTAYRNKLEKGTLVTGIKYSDGEVDIQKIDSSGHKFEDRHKIKEGSTVTIDSSGGVNEKKQPFIKGLKLYAGAEAGIDKFAPQVFVTTPNGWAINANYNVLNKRTEVGLSKKISFKWLRRK